MPDRIFDKHHIDPSHFLFNNKLKLSENASLYLTNTLRTTALGLIGIFLPIYIYKLAGSYLVFNSDPLINNLTWILIYYAVMAVGALLMIFFLTEIVFKRIHLNKAIFISLIMISIEIVLWILAKHNLYLIFVAAFIGGFRKCFYWIPYHVFFEKNFKSISSHFGKSTAKRQFLVGAFSGIAPAVGGVVATKFGFETLFTFSIILLLLAGIPALLKVKDWAHKKHNPRRVFKRIALNRKYLFLTLGHFGEGMEVLTTRVFWPITMFLILVNFEKIGFLSAVSYITASVATLIVGRVIDKHGSKVVHAIGRFVNSTFYFLKFFIQKPFSVYLMNITDRANSPLCNVPSMSIAYEKAEEIGRSDYHIFRETIINLGILFMSLIAILFINFGGNWRILFIVTAFTSFLPYLMNLDEN